MTLSGFSHRHTNTRSVMTAIHNEHLIKQLAYGT